MLRQKLLLFVGLTAVFVGAAGLLYSQRTGALTIFGDASALAASVMVQQPVDLQKGVTAGNGNTQVFEGGIQLRQAIVSRPGTAQFDIGSPEVTQFQRFRSLQSEPSAPGTSVTIQVAGSLDGISFRSLGDPVVLSPGQTIDFTGLVPSGSHFLRLIATLSTTVPGTSPRFDGFGLDYEVLGPLTASGRLDVAADTPTDLAAATAVTINGTLAGTNDADTGNRARREATKQLAATGTDGWLIGLAALWLLLSLTLWLLRPQARRS